MTALILLIILFVFMVMFVAAWLWYLKTETTVAQRFYDVGFKAFEHKDYKKAIKLLLKSLDAKSNSKETLTKLGLAYVEINDFDKARDSFEQVLSNDAKDFDGLYNLALLLQSQNKNEEAKEFYDKALKENINHPDCYFNLGIIAFSESSYDKAIEYFKKAEELSPDNPEISFLIVRCKDELCSYDTKEEGQAVIDEYLAIADKKELLASYNIDLAKAYAKNGQIEESLASCKNALVLNDKDIESYKLLGLIQLLNKDSAGAKSTLSTAIGLDIKNIEAHDILSYVLCQHDDRGVVKKCRLKYQELVKNVIKAK